MFAEVRVTVCTFVFFFGGGASLKVVSFALPGKARFEHVQVFNPFACPHWRDFACVLVECPLFTRNTDAICEGALRKDEPPFCPCPQRFFFPGSKLSRATGEKRAALRRQGGRRIRRADGDLLATPRQGQRRWQKKALANTVVVIRVGLWNNIYLESP